MKKYRLVVCLIGICLSISTLVFGVYSAVRKTYELDGSIQYEVSLAYVNIQTKLYRSQTKLDQAGLTAMMTTLEAAEFGSTVDGVTLIETSDSYTSLPSEENIFTYNSSKLEFKGGDDSCYAYFFVINIVNLSNDNNVKAAVDNSLNGSGIPNTLIANSSAKDTITTSGVNLVLSIGLDNPKVAIDRESLNYKINIESN